MPQIILPSPLNPTPPATTSRFSRSRLPTPSPAPPLIRSLLMRLPLAFALLFIGWPIAAPMQPPWWALVGALLYGGLCAREAGAARSNR